MSGKENDHKVEYLLLQSAGKKDREETGMEDRKKEDNNMELGLEFAPEKRIGLRRAEEYWQQFLHTGSVEDYLNYTAVSREENMPMRVK